MVGTGDNTSSGASFALGNLSTYSRVGAYSPVQRATLLSTSSDSLSVSVNSSDEDNKGESLDTKLLEGQRTTALSNLTAARKVNNQALKDVTSIQGLLEDIQSKVTSFTDLIDKGGTINSSARSELLDDINQLAQRINHEIEAATYKSEAIMGGTYSYNGQLNFATSLFGSDLTTLPHFLSFKAEDDQLSLAGSSDGNLTVEVNGSQLTESATAEEVSNFSSQISTALAQVNQMESRISNRSLFLNIKTTSIDELEIQPPTYEQRPLSGNQKLLQGLFPKNDQLLRLNGQIISITV